jgi:hypothetical protein
MKINKKALCIRKVSNFSVQKKTHKIDKPNFDLKDFQKNLDIVSPKVIKLLDTIKELDENDMKKYNKKFKHIIYTDIKESSAGSKMIAASMMTKGYTNIYYKTLKVNENNLSKNYNNNFALLSSVQIYDKPFPVKLKKHIIELFNKRPDNINGKLIRFIILDSGYKEGIDIFDVKYVHIFEPLITESDEKQVIGRGTRFCGQKGLEFIPNIGWPLHVFKYNLINDDNVNVHELFMNNSGLDLSKLVFATELENISKYGAVDYNLNINIHNFSKTTDNLYTDYKKLSNNEFSLVKKVKNPLGGGIKGKRKKNLNLNLLKAPNKKYKFKELRDYIDERFSRFKWDDIKFENNCVEKQKEIMKKIKYNTLGGNNKFSVTKAEAQEIEDKAKAREALVTKAEDLAYRLFYNNDQINKIKEDEKKSYEEWLDNYNNQKIKPLKVGDIVKLDNGIEGRLMGRLVNPPRTKSYMTEGNWFYVSLHWKTKDLFDKHESELTLHKELDYNDENSKEEFRIEFKNEVKAKDRKMIKKNEKILNKQEKKKGGFNSLPMPGKNLPPSLPPKDERLITFTPTQEFVSNYFNHSSAYKGLLLWHSVGTGKTCSAVSIATKGFEEHNYTILWVTRHTLKSDIWKNMFQQVCSSVIRRQIINKENIPKIIKNNYLKYLSDSWIMPISYKQFSNMLAGKNSIYKIMQKRNGTNDILKKTLVIIDEAHKLYSPDIKASEKPNVEIMNKLIKKSYNISGKDSVKLLLLTATPYTSDPMHLIKLINLMKENDELPDDFNDFSKKYLDETSKFTEKGAEKYLNDIAGYISYLNRDRDVRNFAYPVFYNINANISKSNNLEYLKDNIDNETNKLNENEEKLKSADKKDKKQIKENIKQNKLNIKNYKKELKTESENDISQDNLLQKCIGKK